MFASGNLIERRENNVYILSHVSLPRRPVLRFHFNIVVFTCHNTCYNLPLAMAKQFALNHKIIFFVSDFLYFLERSGIIDGNRTGTLNKTISKLFKMVTRFETVLAL